MYEIFLNKCSSKKVIPISPVSGLNSDIDAFFNECGGRSFENGLYRTHTASSSLSWNVLVTTFFPQYGSDLILFGFDWMGRQFGIDLTRTVTIVMFDPSTAESFRVESGIAAFHNIDLLREEDDLLSKSNCLEIKEKLGIDELGFAECIGYKRPLFIGGEDSIDNYQKQNLEVYWEFNCQIYLQIKGLPPGTKINSINFE
jgi:hypothetical protein